MSVKINNWRKDVPGNLFEVKQGIMAWEFPTVRTINAHGKQMAWRLIVSLDDGKGVPVTVEDSHFDNKPVSGIRGVLTVESGLVGGAIREVVPTHVLVGKNLGRKNATNVFCQALRDGLGKYNKHQRGAGSVTVQIASTSEEHVLYPPMLAMKDDDSARATERIFKGPVFIQPKYNGVRCVVTRGPRGIIMYSRDKKQYYNESLRGFQYIVDELERVMTLLPEGAYIDGELYKHGMSLQAINGITQRENKSGCEKLDYYIFDVFFPNADMTFAERYDAMKEAETASGDGYEYVHFAQTWPVADYESATHDMETFVEAGYEGAMLKASNGLYLYSDNKRRSPDLVKLKPLYDDEFEIADITAGQNGKDQGALMFIMKTDEGKTFTVTPMLRLPERKALYTQLMADDRHEFEEEWLGQKIKVYYASKSNDNIPMHSKTKLER